MKPALACPHCQGPLIQRLIMHRAYGTYRRYLCRSCGKGHTIRTESPETTVDVLAKANAMLRKQAETIRALRERLETPQLHRAKLARWKLRRQARQEAAATGEDVKAIYRRWGVT